MEKKFTSKSQAKAFVERWKVVKKAELNEIRSASVSQKFAVLNALMVSAKKLGWAPLKSEEMRVRKRWIRLRKALHG